MSYKHLSITERGLLLIHLMQGLSLCQIAKVLGRHKSTISRELARNPGDYLPSKAQARYRRRRKKCCSHKLLENQELFALVKKLFLGCHWSSEQIAARLKLENYPIQISYKTIYRAIYAAMFDTPEQRRSEGNTPWQLRGQPLQSITPDRGREFQLHGKVTVALGVEFGVALGLTIRAHQKKV